MRPMQRDSLSSSTAPKGATPFARYFAAGRIAFALLLPLLLLSVSRFEVLDDAYITARYARNLASGQGLVYNPGEHVEGITNLLWALLLALFAPLGIPLDSAAVMLGVSFALLALLCTLRLARLLGVGSGPAYAAVLVLAVNPHYWFTVSNGLEAGLFSLLVVLLLESLLARRPPSVSGLLAGLLFLTRPESAVVAILGALYCAFTHDASALPRRARTRDALTMLGWFAVIASGATLFRLVYYGALLPNSITAKAIPLGDFGLVFANLRRGAIYVVRFGISCFSLVLGAVLAAWMARAPAVWLLLGVAASELPSVLLNGGDWMPHYRLLAMYAPVLAALLAVAFEQLKQRATADLGARALARGLATLVAVATLLTLGWNAWRVPPHVRAGLPGILECYREVGERLIPVLHRGDVVAAEAPGLIGYELPEVYIHDPLGLADAWVARHGTYRPRIGKVDYRYTYHTIHPGLLLAHQDDIWLERFQEAAAERFPLEYKAYFVDPPPPCAPHQHARMVLAIRNDVFERARAALADLRLTAMPIPAGRHTRVLDGTSSAGNRANTLGR